MQSTNYQALDHDEPHVESANIPMQAPGHITTSNTHFNVMQAEREMVKDSKSPITYNFSYIYSSNIFI